MIHIGQAIKNKVEEQGKTTVWLAQELGCHRTNLYKIYEKRTIDTGILLHISEMDWKRLETVEETGVKEGDIIKVKLLEINEKTGKFRLSHRVLMEKPEGYEERPQRPRGERPQRGDRPQRPRGERGERPHRD